ncbi:MAG: serine/threonine-protein kinase [Myxococcota bacterium]
MAFDNDVVAGQVLAGKYRVERVLGQGGMGLVVLAHHLVLDERVAIKLMSSTALSDESIARFEREACAAVRIKSEHVVRVLDVGRFDSGAPYMVMEFLDGEDLATRLSRTGQLPIEEAVDFVLQTCVALADAHSAGIVHRDLKPSNLFCVRRSDGRSVIKLLDFGISKQSDALAELVDTSVTKTGAVMGSPLYMSPEQVQSARDVDARSDIWSLGVVLFELIAGCPPFSGAAFGEVAIKIATEEVPSLKLLRPDAPPALEHVLHRALAKDREQRYASVADLARALQPFAASGAKLLVERITRTLLASATSITHTLEAPVAMAQSYLPGTIAVWSAPGESRAGRWARGGLIVFATFLAAGAILVWQDRMPDPRIKTAPSAATDPIASSTNVAPYGTTAPRIPSVGGASALVQSVPPSTPLIAPMENDPPPLARRPAPRVNPPTGKPTKPALNPGKANCEPPFTLDELGRKRFKPECFLNSP